MASGRQLAQENYETFVAWMSAKTDGDFVEYAFRGKLKRRDIANECGFGKSALTQNPLIRNALDNLESRLRSAGLLGSAEGATEEGDGSRPAEPVVRCSRAERLDMRRLAALEQENAALRVELQQAKALLQRFKLMEQFVIETGRLPR